VHPAVDVARRHRHGLDQQRLDGLILRARHHVGAPVPGRPATGADFAEDDASLSANVRSALGTDNSTRPTVHHGRPGDAQAFCRVWTD
jgi:hypothetical protein